MRTRKTTLLLLSVFIAAQLHAIVKTIEITDYSYEASPQHVGGNTYKAADGTTITLQDGQDPKDPNSYKDENGSHGVPTSRVTRTYTITINIPDAVAHKDTENFIEAEFKRLCNQTYKPDQDATTFILSEVEYTTENKFLGIFPYEEKHNAIIKATIETTVVREQKKTIQQSSSVQIGDPVLMTSGQYRYDEADVTISAGNATLEIGRHYQSGENHGESLGRNWFFSLDTRIIRGTSIQIENESENAALGVTTLEADLAEFNLQGEYFLESYSDMQETLTNDILETNSAINQLRSSGYSSTEEISNYINTLTSKLSILRNKLFESQSDRMEMLKQINTYKYEYEQKLDEAKDVAAELKHAADYSIYNRMCNTRSERGYGFDEHTDIGTEIIVVYDTYGRKSLYSITTESNNIQNSTENPYPNGAETENISGSNDTLKIKPDGSYILTKRDGTVWKYGTNGMLNEIEDRSGNTISVSYENGEAKSISRNGKTIYLLEHEGGKISAIINARDASDRIEYLYSNGTLSGVKDNDGDIISFGYRQDNDMLLEIIQKPDGSAVFIEYGYVRGGENLVSQTYNEENFCESFSYSQSGKKVEHTTHSGITTIYEYDTNQQLTKETAADGTTKEYGYDDDGNVIWEKLNGNTTSFTYNRYGEKTRADYSDGSFESWTYDTFGLVTSQRDRDGTTYEYIRDAQGNLTSVRCGGRLLFSYTYDNKGQVISMTMHRIDGTSYIQRFSYDIYGNMVERITGASGSIDSIKESWTYDGRNRILSYAINGRIEETYTYDGRQTIVNSANGLLATYTTDNRKDCTSVLEKDTLTGETRLTETTYDRRHLPVKRTLSAGTGEQPVVTAEYRYLPGGEPLAELISSGGSNIVTIYGYMNESGKMIDSITNIKRILCTDEQLKNAGMSEDAGLYAVDLQELYTKAEDAYSLSYNREIMQTGTSLTVTAPDGLQTVTEYDVWSRPVATTDSSGVTSAAEYTPAGRLRREQSPYGGFYVYTYDATGSLLGTGKDGGIQYSVENNPDGNPYKVTDRNGKTTEYTYDSMNRLSKVTQEAGSTYLFYDPNGRVTLSITGGDGSTTLAEEYTSYEYSNDGRTVTVSLGGLYPTKYILDAWGETVSVTDGEGNTISISYDCAGRITSETDAYGNRTSYEYDVRGLVTKAIYPDGTISEYRYDVYGNMTESILCGKTVWQGSYDSAGRLIASSSDLSPDTSYHYDEAGRLSVITTAGVLTSSYAYDDRGRTVTVTSGNGNEYKYNYDAYGLLSSETNRSGLTQRYTYDDEDEISALLSFSGKTSSYATMPDGRSKITTHSDGTSSTIEYTLSGRVKSFSNPEGSFVYEYDKGGLLIKQSDMTTGETVSFSYDRAGRKTKITGESRNVSMSYGKNGELTQIYDSTSSTGYTIKYDVMMRETTRMGNNGIRTETSYNQDGSVEAIITKDSHGSLLSAEAYVYDDNGRKEASINIDGEVTLYEYDAQGRLSKILYPDNDATALYEQRVIDEFNISERRYSSAEARYLSKKVYDNVARFQILCHNKVGMIPSYRNFRVERFTYDADGNLIKRFIGGALIEYAYDEDDRLVSCNNGGKTLYAYSYDDDGNLVRISSPSAPGKDSVFAYDGSGRMTSSITYGNKGLPQESTYGYDALGRRVRTNGTGRGTVRTVYDGTSMEILRETSTGKSVIQNETSQDSIIPYGERYRYITDNNSTQRTLAEEYTMTDTTGFRTRTTLYIGGSPVAVSADGESRYLGCDDSGSVTLMTDTYGRETASVSYDVFGSPVARTSDTYGTDSMTNIVLSRAAYAGKPYDNTTGLYDYGFRDYSPALARFTTPDPIRDGTNWYTYCSGDPINFVDKWGLKQVIAEDIVQLNNNRVMNNNSGNLKKQTKIEIQRSPDDNGNNGKYYQSKLSIMINDDISLFSTSVQSTADHPDLSENDGTISTGTYNGTLWTSSGSYLNAINLFSDYFIHPDQITNEKKQIERIADGKTNGPWNQPLSKGCLILKLSDFNNTIDNLQNLGFEFNNKDTVKVEINDKTDKTIKGK